MNDIADWMDN